MAEVSRRKRILVVVGTRPEGVKLAPVALAALNHPDVSVAVCSTGQHRTMLQQVLDVFDVKLDYDLAVMRENQGLAELAATTLSSLQGVLTEFRPDWVVVQGDTTTAFVAAVGAFYNRIAVAHVEAGLRTYDLSAPFPEEGNRQLIGRLASRHYAPTETSRRALLAEGVDDRSVLVTGNTVVDALYHVRNKFESSAERTEHVEKRFGFLSGKPLILVTGHRRESFGEGFAQICTAISEIAARHDVEIVYPVHLNPNVREPVHRLLGGRDSVHLIEPVDYETMVYLMGRAHFILTDSGGVQEEAPAFGKPVLVMRTKTERMEAVDAGVAKLVGTDVAAIVGEAHRLLTDPAAYQSMVATKNPFGDGAAAHRIIEDLITAPKPAYTI